jgi:hypothetical protein
MAERSIAFALKAKVLKGTVGSNPTFSSSSNHDRPAAGDPHGSPALLAYLVCGASGMYLLALMKGLDTVLLGSTWSNMFSILLTNSFSIIGTIMGVKYASEEKE